MRAGSLTPAGNRNLRSRLERIREHFDKAWEKRYGLSVAEVASFKKQLDALGKEVYGEKHGLQATRIDDRIIRRINEMQKRIETGNPDGFLTCSAAKGLQASLDGRR